MGNSKRLKVSFLFQPFIGPLIQLPPSTWPFTTLPWHRHSNIENSQTFINQIFFSVLLSFSCPPTEGYIWFLLFGGLSVLSPSWKGFWVVCVRACVNACTDMRKKSAEKTVWTPHVLFFPRFHLIKLKVAEIQTDPSLIDLYTVHRANTINPLPDTTGPGRGLFLEMSGGGKNKTQVGEGHDVSGEGN